MNLLIALITPPGPRTMNQPKDRITTLTTNGDISNSMRIHARVGVPS